MSEVSKAGKILEMALSKNVRDNPETYMIPESINIYDSKIDKEFFFYDEFFNPLIVMYADFIYQEVYSGSLFDIDYIKTENNTSLFGISIEDKTGEEDPSDDPAPNSLKLLFLIESLSQLFPKNMSLSKMPKFYTNLSSEINQKIYNLPVGSKINIKKTFNSVLKDALYANLIKLGNQQKIKQNI